MWVLFGVPSASFANHAKVGEPNKPIRFGLTAVVLQENLRFLDEWSFYLSNKLGHKVEFVRRKSYREIMDLLASGSLDFAWICGFPYVQKRDPEFIKLLSVPIYKGKPLYHSYVIVHKDSPHQTVDDLKGKTFAYSDPNSNSGYLYPQYLLAENGANNQSYFRKSFFTFSHAETVEAVAERFSDGGAVDSYIWDSLKEFRPDLVAQTRVIKQSPSFGFPPLVSRVGVDLEIVWLMERVLKDMADDPDGRVFLEGLKLDGFGDFPRSLFNNIQEMAAKIRSSHLDNRRPAVKASINTDTNK